MQIDYIIGYVGKEASEQCRNGQHINWILTEEEVNIGENSTQRVVKFTSKKY